MMMIDWLMMIGRMMTMRIDWMTMMMIDWLMIDRMMRTIDWVM